MADVTLHVYDLSHGMVGSMSQGILGFHVPYLPHTGIVVRARASHFPAVTRVFHPAHAPQVNGWEYFFGGGIQRERPAAVTASTGMTPCERKALGRTSKTEAEIAAFLRSPGMAGKFTAARYDLFTNNCNHFSHDLAVFLTGTGIPDAIVRLPERVAQSPMGAMVLQMWRGAAGGPGGAGAGGGGDPLASAFGGSGSGGGSSGGDPFAGVFPAAAAAPGGGAAAAPRAAPPPSAIPAAPVLADYPDASGAALIGARIGKAGAEAGAHAAFVPTAEEAALLAGLGARLAEPPGAAWGAPACALAARLLAPDVPQDKGSFPGALLARLLALRPDCQPLLVAPGGAVAALLAGLAAAPCAWTLPSAVNQALQACANALCGAQGRAWVEGPAAPGAALAAVVARELGNAEREDCRRLAAACAGNLVAAGGRWDGGGGGGVGEEEAPEWALPLLTSLLGGIGGERSGEVAKKRLQAAGWLLRAPRCADTTLRALAISLDAFAPLQLFANAPATPAELRALAQEVLALLH
jgi:hypothetical protein